MRTLSLKSRAIIVIVMGVLASLSTPESLYPSDYEYAGGCTWCSDTCTRTAGFCSGSSGSCTGGAGSCSSGTACSSIFGNEYPHTITCQMLQ
jgi:hypothetical protein